MRYSGRREGLIIQVEFDEPGGGKRRTHTPFTAAGDKIADDPRYLTRNVAARQKDLSGPCPSVPNMETGLNDTESHSFGHRGGDEEPTLPAGGQARGRTPTWFKEHVQASFSAHGAREGVAPRAYARGGGDASPGNCGDNEEGRMRATRYPYT